LSLFPFYAGMLFEDPFQGPKVHYCR